MAAQTILQENQTYHEILIHYLLKLVRAPHHEEKWRQLLLVGAGDDAVAETYSEYDRNKHALEKAGFVVTVIKVLHEHTKFNTICTWQQACEASVTSSSGRFHWKKSKNGTWTFITTSTNLTMTSTLHAGPSIQMLQKRKDDVAATIAI